MAIPEDQIAELKRVFLDATQYAEGGIDYFLIPQMSLPDGCVPPKIDTLLCAGNRDGYPSRLFFGQQIQSKNSLNWNGVNTRIIEKNWFAYSWKVEPNGLRLVQLVLAHMRALR